MATQRHELKYFIAMADMPGLMQRLAGALTPDPHGDAFNEYLVRSLYFDDAFNSAYHDKLDGVRDRDKYRIRLYNLDDSAVFLERKRKVGDLIEKTSARITRRLAAQLIGGDPTGLEKMDNALIRDLFIQMRLNCLRPKVIVDYDRSAYEYPAEHVRVTFDKRVRSGLTAIRLFDEKLGTIPVLEAGHAILEVKYDRYLPDFIAALLASIPAERSAISKYTLCRQFAP